MAGELDAPVLALSILSAPLGWFMPHILFAFRYAHIYYSKAKAKAKPSSEAGGLKFPGRQEACGWDFVYYSFVVGTTAQVSDVNITTTSMRKITWGHSVVAFFYNTVLIALAVDIAVQGGGSP